MSDKNSVSEGWVIFLGMIVFYVVLFWLLTLLDLKDKTIGIVTFLIVGSCIMNSILSKGKNERADKWVGYGAIAPIISTIYLLNLPDRDDDH